MHFSGRAYYNLLWLESLRGNRVPSLEFEIRDYRSLDLKDLFQKLEGFNIFFDIFSFQAFSEGFESPEELAESFGIKKDESQREVYLLCFELWRRLLPDRECVSIFCDRVDRKIAAYTKDQDDEELLAILKSLLEILDRNTSSTEPPTQIFYRLSLFLAHDIENVIYTYIDSHIKSGAEGGFLDLLDHFMPYVSEKRALQFLKLKSLPSDFYQERERLTGYLVSSLQESENLPLSIALLFYLIKEEDVELFSEFFAALASKHTQESVLVSLLDVLVEFHRRLGKKEKMHQVEKYLEKHLEPKQGKKVITAASVLEFL